MFSVTTKACRDLLLVLFVHFGYIVVFFPFSAQDKIFVIEVLKSLVI